MEKDIRGNFWQRPMVVELYKTGGEQKIAFTGDRASEESASDG